MSCWRNARLIYMVIASHVHLCSILVCAHWHICMFLFVCACNYSLVCLIELI